MGRGVYTALNDGLRALGLTPSEVKLGYTYIGRCRDSNYFLTTDQERPAYVDKCVCGHKIAENRYLRSPANGHTITMGNCCIKQFIEGGRACQNCGASHRNRKDNICSHCRLPKCTVCLQRFRREYGHHEKCEGCYRNPPKPAIERLSAVAKPPSSRAGDEHERSQGNWHDSPRAREPEPSRAWTRHEPEPRWTHHELYTKGSSVCDKCNEVLRPCEAKTCASCSSRYFTPARAL